jgi:hypothetical protein
MKKILVVMLAVVALAGVAVGDMDDKLYDLTAVGARTNSAAYVLRGRLEAVHIDVTAPATSTVTVAAEDGRTLFTKADIAADAVYLPRAQGHTTAGVALAYDTYATTYAVTMTTNTVITYNHDSSVTNSNTVVTYNVVPTAAATSVPQVTLQPMADKITVTLVGQNGNAVTNNTKVRLVYER